MLKIKTLKPATLPLGTTPKIAVAGITGNKAEVRSILLEELEQQSAKQGFFTILNENGKVKITKSEDGKIVLEDADSATIYLNIQLNDSVSDQTVLREEYWENGIRKYRDLPTRTTTTLMQVTAIKENQTIFNEKIIGKAELPRDTDILTVEVQSAKDCVLQFLNQITPKWVYFEIKPDESDSGQKTILELMKKNDFEEARKAIEIYRKEKPENAVAIYNHALILDALSEYAAALELYDKALQVAAKDFYSKYRNECQQRLEMQKKLAP